MDEVEAYFENTRGCGIPDRPDVRCFYDLLAALVAPRNRLATGLIGRYLDVPVYGDLVVTGREPHTNAWRDVPVHAEELRSLVVDFEIEWLLPDPTFRRPEYGEIVDGCASSAKDCPKPERWLSRVIG